MSDHLMANQRSFQVMSSNVIPALMFSAFVTILFGIKLWVIGTYGNATPYWDQWDAEAANLYNPFFEGTLGWVDLLAPHNEHRIFTTRLLSLALLIVNGIWNPLLQMVVNAILHILAISLGIAMLTRVIGRRHLPSLLAFSLLLFGVPYGWENTLAGFQSQFYFVLLFSIACLWLTVTKPPLSVGWWGGVACAIFAFFSLASGIFAAAAAAITALLLYVKGQRNDLGQLLAAMILIVLFILGAILIPFVEGHVPLKAASLYQLLSALMAILSWPLPSHPVSVIICNLPALIFVGLMLWKSPPADDRRWFLLSLVVWILAQALSIAYGRAVGPMSSRYLDLFAIGILVNFACLISVLQGYFGNRQARALIEESIWVVIIMISLGVYAVKNVSNILISKRDDGVAQEINTRNYLATGDIYHLKNKPYLHVPYPSPERLASILALPAVREILPSNISPPLAYTSIESNPPDSFVSEGYYPFTPDRAGMTLGSYSAQGDLAMGQARVQFDSNRQSSLLALPVAGYPLNDGIKLEVEQNGKRIPAVVKSNPREAWGKGYIMVNEGPFTVVLTDSSSENASWLAVGVPYITGRLDALTNALLINYPVFIMLGGMLVMLLSRINLIIPTLGLRTNRNSDQ